MKKITIGKNITASKIAYGCMRIGRKTEKEAQTAVLTAIDCGVDFFDNADIYCDGVSEEFFCKSQTLIERDIIFVH